MRSKTVDLQDPVRKKKKTQSKSNNQQVHIELACRDPPHVAPPCAPQQNQCIQPNTAKKQCAWWPCCDEDANICGGCTKVDCNIFGRMGTKRAEAPSDQEIQVQIRLKTWTPIMMKRHCHWGCGLALYCGGTKSNTCEKYGKNGTHKDSRPTEAQIEQMKKTRALGNLVDNVIQPLNLQSTKQEAKWRTEKLR